MAQDITLDYSAGNTTFGWTSTALDSLADGSSAQSDYIDTGEQGPVAMGVRVTLVGNSASNTGYVYVRWHPSNNGSTPPDNDLAPLLGVILMSGTATRRLYAELPVYARHGRLAITNDSGDALASSGNSAAYWEIAVDQA